MEKPKDNTILSVLEGKSDPESMQHVISWFATEEGKTYLSEHMDKEFEHKGYPYVDILPSRQVWENIRRRIHKESHPHFRWLKVAAIVLPLVIILCGSYVANRYVDLFGTATTLTVNVPKGEEKIVVLPDGTSAYLGPGSSLSYPDRFRLQQRTVRFSGDAYFDVAHERYRSFDIELSDMRVKVLGTSFNLMASPASPEINLHLDKGRVNIFLNTGVKCSLFPGDNIIYNKRDKSLRQSQNLWPTVYADWKNKKIMFKDATLAEVINVLSVKYDIKFIVQTPEIKSFRYTIDWEEKSLVELLQDMGKITPISFSQTGNTIILKKRI